MSAHVKYDATFQTVLCECGNEAKCFQTKDGWLCKACFDRANAKN